MDDLEFLKNTDFSLEVSGDDREIEIRPYVDADSECSRTLIASLRMDSMEMIESARIRLAPGKNHVPLQQTIRIFKPLLWHPRGAAGRPSLYHFSMIFHHSGAPCHTIEKRSGIRFLDPAPDDKKFRINGQTLILKVCEPDFSLDEDDLSSRLTGNLVYLRDTDPELEMKLDRCCASGLIAALELTGGMEPEDLARRPGVCVFTAEAGSEGEQIYQRTRHFPLPPFFTRDELNSMTGK